MEKEIKLGIVIIGILVAIAMIVDVLKDGVLSDVWFNIFKMFYS